MHASQVPRSLRLTFDEDATQEELARLARKGRKGLVATMLIQEGAATKHNRARQVGRMKQGAKAVDARARVELFVQSTPAPWWLGPAPPRPQALQGPSGGLRPTPSGASTTP